MTWKFIIHFMQKYKAAEKNFINTQLTGTNSRTKDRVDKHAVCIAGAKFFFFFASVPL